MRPFLSSFREFAGRKYPGLNGTLESHVEKLSDDSDIEGLLSSLSKAEELGAAMPSASHMNTELERWAAESRSIKAHLVSYIIERCEQFDRGNAERGVAPWLERLHNSNTLSSVHFFTTNYDRILEYVSEYTKIPLDDGFAASEGDLVAPWTGEFASKLRLYKLHGSVTYYVDRQRGPTREFLRLDRGYPLPGPEFRLSRQGRELEPLMVLPTLEKEAMDDPYGHLMHVFSETLSKGGLVVAMGTSLRDAHLVSAMNFSRKKIITLIIDSAPELAVSQIQNARTVSLKTDMSHCLKYLSAPLLKLAEDCCAICDDGELFSVVSDFAVEQSESLRAASRISTELRKQIDLLTQTDREASKLEVIRDLQGVKHPEVLKAVAACLEREQPELLSNLVYGGLVMRPLCCRR